MNSSRLFGGTQIFLFKQLNQYNDAKYIITVKDPTEIHSENYKDKLREN